MNEIDWGALKTRRRLEAIDFRIEKALALLQDLTGFVHELDSVPFERAPDTLFWLHNGMFSDSDAVALYTLLRYLKPKRYIELGCGWSSFISSTALARNATNGFVCDALYADPEPRRDLQELLATGRILKQRVQDVPMDLFTSLEAGDVLFIDTSHVLKVQSDVEHEILRVLPSLRPGVWIHFHDFFSPYDYPESWVRRPNRFTLNEQYAVECLLSGGSRFQVELPLYLLWKEQSALLKKFFPRNIEPPRSFWIRKIE
jgi:hypothetical protein